MEYKNFWKIGENLEEDLKYTDSIQEIIEEQCKYLFQQTQGMIFGVFSEIKRADTVDIMAKSMSNIVKNISGITNLQKTFEESTTNDLIDANDMYFDKCYGFEICTEKYRFRLFELRMTPIYPVEIIVDEGICNNIGNTLRQIAIPTEKFNRFKISDEETFCKILQSILQDKKVRYIIAQLQNRIQSENKKKDCLPKKVIICEGRTDEVILQAIAQKLNQKVTIITANGKYKVPTVFDTVNRKSIKTNILIVVDSDGDEQNTKKMIVDKIGDEEYELAIINNTIEDWFTPDVANFSKLKLMQTIDTIIEDIDFAELSKVHESFAKVVTFLQK
jgi:5S rRNA maturation endonuclease (ribonuclease M5)